MLYIIHILFMLTTQRGAMVEKKYIYSKIKNNKWKNNEKWNIKQIKKPDIYSISIYMYVWNIKFSLFEKAMTGKNKEFKKN